MSTTVAVTEPSNSTARAEPQLASRQARRTNNPLAGIDTNTGRGRRIADLVRAYLRALGNPGDIERQAAVIAAAELQVLAEEARAAALRQPGQADLNQVVRMQGAADRAVKALGIKPGAADAEPTFSDVLRADWEKQRQAAAAAVNRRGSR